MMLFKSLLVGKGFTDYRLNIDLSCLKCYSCHTSDIAIGHHFEVQWIWNQGVYLSDLNGALCAR